MYRYQLCWGRVLTRHRVVRPPCKDLAVPADGRAFCDPRARSKGSMALAFSPDSRTLVSGGDDHKIRLWDTATGQEQGTIRRTLFDGEFPRLLPRRPYARQRQLR